MMSSVAGINTKRRRVSAANSSPLCFSDLPTGILEHVSSFLASPSRALFAVALISRDVERSSAIVGSRWNALDFGDIEKELAAKLSDHHISGVLLCIDAVNNLKKLRLTNCINITGIGLEPLRGSAIIEQIDLSLVADHESPELDPEPPISCNEVLPLLDSIVERGGESALKHLQFPKVWRKERNIMSDFHAFLTGYNEMLENRDLSCLKCSCNLPHDGQMLEVGYGSYYGTQSYTCNNCMRYYCYDCKNDDVDCMSALCSKCERSYCFNCSREGDCNCCESWFCVDCGDFKGCSRCHENTCPECVVETWCRGCGVDRIFCQDCFDNHGAFSCCQDCDVVYCDDCCDSNVYGILYCVDCEESLCGRCRVNKCEEGRNCIGCYEVAFSALTKDKDRQREECQTGDFPQQSEWRNDRGIPNGIRLNAPSAAPAQAEQNFYEVLTPENKSSE